MLQKSIIGCLLGTAIGDAFGLPYEGLSKRSIFTEYFIFTDSYFSWVSEIVSTLLKFTWEEKEKNLQISYYRIVSIKLTI